VRLSSRQQNHLAAAQAMGLAENDDFGLAFQHLHQSIERRGVFA
jgi:hypothetical protein